MLIPKLFIGVAIRSWCLRAKLEKLFVREMTALFNAYAQGSALEVVALTAAMVACALFFTKTTSDVKVPGPCHRA